MATLAFIVIYLWLIFLTGYLFKPRPKPPEVLTPVRPRDLLKARIAQRIGERNSR